MYSQTHDYAEMAALTELQLGLTSYAIAVENQSATESLEVSLDGSNVEKTIPPGESWHSGAAVSSVWLRRLVGTGGVHNALVEAHAPPPEPTPAEPTLNALRQRKKESINDTTRKLITKGVEYPSGSGRFFSMSDAAQRNWTDLDRNADDPDITYPLFVSAADDSVLHMLADADEVRALYRENALRRLQVYGGGVALKAACDAAKTIAELDAIHDDREAQ